MNDTRCYFDVLAQCADQPAVLTVTGVSWNDLDEPKIGVGVAKLSPPSA